MRCIKKLYKLWTPQHRIKQNVCAMGIFNIHYQEFYAFPECLIWMKYNLKHLIYTWIPQRVHLSLFLYRSSGSLTQTLQWFPAPSWYRVALSNSWSVVCMLIIDIWVGAGLGWQACLSHSLCQTWKWRSVPLCPNLGKARDIAASGQHCCYCLLISQPFMWQYHWGLCWPGGCSIRALPIKLSPGTSLILLSMKLELFVYITKWVITLNMFGFLAE
jgi:hypothetical protein